MGQKLKDLTGIRFGKLTVINYAGYNVRKTGRKYHKWDCFCDCGNKKTVESRMLLSGHTQSCGCMHKNPPPPIKHGMTDTRLYAVYKAMKQRCCNPNDKSYKNYGGRGITICDKWLGEDGFMNFYHWSIKNGYDENAPRGECTIDRIDNDSGYSPDNCRWVDSKVQAMNKQTTARFYIEGEKLNLIEISNKYGIDYNILRGRIYTNKDTIERAVFDEHIRDTLLTCDGITLPLKEWCKITGISLSAMHQRIGIHKWTHERAIKTPMKKPKTYTYRGISHTISEWSKIANITSGALWHRIKRGMSIEEALTTKMNSPNMNPPEESPIFIKELEALEHMAI